METEKKISSYQILGEGQMSMQGQGIFRSVKLL